MKTLFILRQRMPGDSLNNKMVTTTKRSICLFVFKTGLKIAHGWWLLLTTILIFLLFNIEKCWSVFFSKLTHWVEKGENQNKKKLLIWVNKTINICLLVNKPLETGSTLLYEPLLVDTVVTPRQTVVSFSSRSTQEKISRQSHKIEEM